MSGGILVCGSGNNNATLFFVRLGGGDAFFFLCDIDLRFRSVMNSVVYVMGGTAHFERVKIDKQYENKWVNPLIEVNSTISSATVNFLYSNITNCYYAHANTSSSLFKSAVFFFTNTSTNRAITLNLHSSSFRNDSLYLCDSSYTRGAFCQFNGSSGSSVISFLLIFFSLFFFCVVLLIN
jgi:hypothetical protein